MTRTLRILLLVLSIAAPGYAQTIPDWEVFGGYSWQRSNLREYFKSTPIIYSVRNKAGNLNGFDVAFTENINPGSAAPSISAHILRRRKFRPVRTRRAHVFGDVRAAVFLSEMVGVDAVWACAGRRCQYGCEGHAHGSAPVRYSFGLAAGGGLDVKAGGKTAFRLVQAEYFHANSLGASQNNFRLSAGVILYLGNK